MFHRATTSSLKPAGLSLKADGFIAQRGLQTANAAAEADKNYLIFRCGNDEGGGGGGDDVDVRREGLVDPPVIGCDGRLNSHSIIG